VSHHIDYITPGIKLMSGGYDEKIAKRMVGRRSITGDLGGKHHHGSKTNNKGKGKGKGKGRKCHPNHPADPDDDDSIFRVTGPCSDEITPHCIRGKPMFSPSSAQP
jgi:tripeptidyl-peptidase-1